MMDRRDYVLFILHRGIKSLKLYIIHDMKQKYNIKELNGALISSIGRTLALPGGENR